MKEAVQERRVDARYQAVGKAAERVLVLLLVLPNLSEHAIQRVWNDETLHAGDVLHHGPHLALEGTLWG